MLCDALALDPHALTPQRLAALRDVGSRLEWLGIAAHDAVHVERDKRLGAPNAVVAWLGMHAAGAKDPEAFRADVNALADVARAAATGAAGGLIDPTQIARSVAAIDSYFASPVQ